MCLYVCVIYIYVIIKLIQFDSVSEIKQMLSEER